MNAYIFYNCDEYKSIHSMNPISSTYVYADNDIGRLALWNKIVSELRDKSIEIDKNYIPQIRESIFNGSPLEANVYINYGFIWECELSI